MSSFLSDSPLLLTCRIIAKYSSPTETGQRLILIDIEANCSEEIRSPFSSFGSLHAIEEGNELWVATIGSSPKRSSAVALLRTSLAKPLADITPEQWIILKESSKVQVIPIS